MMLNEVGMQGLEPRTNELWVRRSNRLSYIPSLRKIYTEACTFSSLTRS